MNHSNEHIEKEYVNNVRKNKIKAKDSLLKLAKDGEIEDNTVKYVKYLFRLKQKQPNKQKTKQLKM